MNYWLVKSEPFKYSWEQFVNDGKTFWDGVRNYTARNNLRAMKRGDHVLFYHSNEGLAIVGIAEVLKEAYQDPTTTDSNWVVVDLKPLRAINNPVTLAQVKAEPKLKDMDLVRLSRLSVGAVREGEYRKILLTGENLVIDVRHVAASLISIALDYYDQGSFIKEFKSYTGLTPTQANKDDRRWRF